MMSPPAIDQNTHNIALAGVDYATELLPPSLSAKDKSAIQAILYEAILSALMVQVELRQLMPKRKRPLYSRN